MKGGKVLGIDYGTKRIGLATGDLFAGIAFPKTVIRNQGLKRILEDLKGFIDEWGIDMVVVGLPLNQNGYVENQLIDEVGLFAKELHEKFKVEVKMLDEGFSSFEADQLREDLMDKGEGEIGRDAYAAQIILQRFFDKQDG